MPRDRAPALRIDLAWRLRTPWRALALLRRVARHTAAAEGFRSGNLSVAVVGARAMATLHRRFMNIPGPSDVLSFDLGCDRNAGYLEAEIILCADVARQRAAARGGTRRAAREELALYLVHGLLHLAGYDDHTARDFQRMHAREDELLVELGLGAVYRAGLHTISPL